MEKKSDFQENKLDNYEVRKVKVRENGFPESSYHSPKEKYKSSHRILVKKDDQSYLIEDQPNTDIR